MTLADSTDSAWDVVVVGAGPAGMMAAIGAAQRGRRTLLLEKNRKPGVKILMSGGTRCNLTHAADPQAIVAAFGKPGRFLHSALAGFAPQHLVELVEAEGVATKVEPGGKIYPVSDRALDVLDALARKLARTRCKLALGEPLLNIERADARFLLATPLRQLTARNVVLTTGGASYPRCGTAGDGYRWAAAMGHTVIPPRPALVPVTTNVSWVSALKGVTVADVQVRVMEYDRPAFASGDRLDPGAGEGRCLAERRHSFLFTHFGLSGPAVLDVSRAISGHAQRKRLALLCDFLPSVICAQLDDRLRQQCAAAGKRQVLGLVAELLPQRLLESLFAQAGLAPDCRAGEFGRAARERLGQAIKNLPLPVTGTLGFEKAEVTAGGVALEEVDSRSMQSKLVPGLYIAGELLDLDGPIGGYNFQAAFSTGWLAGMKV